MDQPEQQTALDMLQELEESRPRIPIWHHTLGLWVYGQKSYKVGDDATHNWSRDLLVWADKLQPIITKLREEQFVNNEEAKKWCVGCGHYRHSEDCAIKGCFCVVKTPAVPAVSPDVPQEVKAVIREHSKYPLASDAPVEASPSAGAQPDDLRKLVQVFCGVNFDQAPGPELVSSLEYRFARAAASQDVLARIDGNWLKRLAQEAAEEVGRGRSDGAVVGEYWNAIAIRVRDQLSKGAK